MHETALMAQLLRRVEREATAAGAERVTAIRLSVGELAGVESSLLGNAFEVLAASTLADGARLEVSVVPLECECEACHRRFRVEQFRFRCPSCGAGNTRVVAGEELILESIDVQTSPVVAGTSP
jgi:hydrogenase nickel incorporation protein HypA/HybF